MTGRELELRPTTWIQRPDGYSSVGFRATLPKGPYGSLQGEMVGAGCSDFSFTRRR